MSVITATGASCWLTGDVEAGVKDIVLATPDPDDTLLAAAHLAGVALDTRSMGLHHAVCHVVGGLTRIPHGIVNAIVRSQRAAMNSSAARKSRSNAAASHSSARTSLTPMYRQPSSYDASEYALRCP